MGTAFDAFMRQPTEEQPLEPPETFGLAERDDAWEQYEVEARSGVLSPRVVRRAEGGALDNWLAKPASSANWENRPLSLMDYVGDVTMETLAGIAEGATLEHAEFGDIGPVTDAGDIARVIGKFGGTVVSYSAIAAMMGYLGIFTSLAMPAVVGRAGLTAFIARLFSAGEEDEDMIDRVIASAQNGIIGAAAGSIPFALDKAILRYHGGPTKYMELLKGRLSKHMVRKFGFDQPAAQQAAREFEAAVSQQGGAQALSRTAIKRLAKGKEALGEWRTLSGRIHGAAFGKKGLGLSRDTYQSMNMAQVGKAHVSEMSVVEMRDLDKYYRELTRRSAAAGPTSTDYTTMLSQYTNYKPGYFAGHEPVERVMRKAGPAFQKMYDGVYDGKIASITEEKAFGGVRRHLVKGVTKQQKMAMAYLQDNVEIPMNVDDVGMRAIYRKAASRFGVQPQNVDKVVWMRSTQRSLLKRMNLQLAAEGKQVVVERPAYMTHLIEDTAQSMGGITPELWAIMKFGKGHRGFSRFLQQRVGAGNIVLDPFKAHRAYTKAALKMIHLAPARQHINRMMGAKTVLQDGKRVPLELPYTMRKYVDDWLAHGVMEVSTDLDKHLNITLNHSAKAIASRIKMAGYMGTLWGNPLSVIKNTTQQTLNIARLGKHWLSGIGSFNPKREFMQGLNGWQFAEKYSKLLRGRAPAMEGLDPLSMGRLMQVGFSPFRAVDKANVVAGFNGGVKKYLAEGKSFPQAVKLADKLVRDTQFNYLNIDMPLRWLSAPGRLGSQFQSWWTRYIEEVWSWGGTMPYGDGTGRTIRIAKHAFNVVKSKEMARYLMINSMLLYGMYEAGAGVGLITQSLPVPFVNSGPLPRGLPPAVDGVLGMGQSAYGIAIGDEKIRAEGLRRVSRLLGTHTVPGWTTLRKIYRINKGKLPPKALFLPLTEKEYKDALGD